MRIKLTILFSILFGLNSFAQLSMPKIFGNSMVLQRNTSIPIWGTTSANAIIEIKINNQTKNIKSDASGHWKIVLDSMSAGGPFTCTISEKINNKQTSTLIFNDVMIGDVWLASGQSNMELKLSESLNGKEEIAKAQLPNIRFFQVPQTLETEPQTDFKSGQWQQCDTSTSKIFSAVAYYFSKQISQEQGVAVGIIQSTWGGSPVETWTSKEALMTIPECKKKIEENTAANISQTSFQKAKDDEKQFFDILYNSLNGEKLHFTEIDFNDQNWEKIKMPKTFRDSSTFQEIYWLRKSIDIPKSMIGKDLKINLGYPEMMYNLYFNGKQICKNAWNAQKQNVYKIPAANVIEGKNVIIVRLAMMWSGGGIDNPADSLYITDKNQTISLAGDWKFIKNIETPFPRIIYYHKYPTYLFNGMIHPLIPFALKGFLWYQGEENASNPIGYALKFQLLICDWRKLWQQGNLPFVYVQLPNFMKQVPLQFHSNWSLIREAQLQTLSVPSTAMAVSIDLGQADDIHPKNKAEVGKRLALAANFIAYNKQNAWMGPKFSYAKYYNDSVVVFLSTPLSQGLKMQNTIVGFEIAGDDKTFYSAEGIQHKDYVVLKHPNVHKPIAVRYGWGDNPKCNLYTIEGLPASPFRTDEW